MISDFDDFNIAFFEVFAATVNLDSASLDTLGNLDGSNYRLAYSITGVSLSTFQELANLHNALEAYNLSDSDFSQYLYNSALNLNLNNDIDMTLFYNTFTNFNPTQAVACWKYALWGVARAAGSAALGVLSANPVGAGIGAGLAVVEIWSTTEHLLENGPDGNC